MISIMDSYINSMIEKNEDVDMSIMDGEVFSPHDRQA